MFIGFIVNVELPLQVTSLKCVMGLKSETLVETLSNNYYRLFYWTYMIIVELYITRSGQRLIQWEFIVSYFCMLYLTLIYVAYD